MIHETEIELIAAGWSFVLPVAVWYEATPGCTSDMSRIPELYEPQQQPEVDVVSVAALIDGTAQDILGLLSTEMVRAIEDEIAEHTQAHRLQAQEEAA
jgi:hypothetical protein